MTFQELGQWQSSDKAWYAIEEAQKLTKYMRKEESKGRKIGKNGESWSSLISICKVNNIMTC